MPLRAIGLGTATYTNGLLVGEVIPVLSMLPVVVPLLQGSWRLALAFWALPVALTAWLVYARAPRFPDPYLAARGGVGAPGLTFPIKLNQRVRHRDVPLVTHISNQHLPVAPTRRLFRRYCGIVPRLDPR